MVTRNSMSGRLDTSERSWGSSLCRRVMKKRSQIEGEARSLLGRRYGNEPISSTCFQRHSLE